MNSVVPQSSIKHTKYVSTAHNPVCENRPFVGSKNRHSLPLIGFILPPRQNRLTPNRSHGFTLIELIITVVLVAVLLSWAVPNFQALIKNSRLNTQANDLLADINLARSEAIKRRTDVVLCTSTNGTSCAVGGNWKDGRLVIVGGATVLRYRGPLTVPTDTLNSSGPDSFSFDRTGALTPTPVANPYFTFCDDRGASFGKKIDLNAVGQASVNLDVLGSCN
jgi:type IV fimbrial biogenesis protein FimT